MQNIKLFTDGSYADKRGGWSALIIYPNGTEHRLAGYVPRCNGAHAMERLAVIEAFQRLQASYQVTVYTDSQFVISGATGDITKGHYYSRNIALKAVQDRRVWHKLNRLLQPHDVTFKYTNSGELHLEVHHLSRWARMNERGLDRITLPS